MVTAIDRTIAGYLTSNGRDAARRAALQWDRKRESTLSPLRSDPPDSAKQALEIVEYYVGRLSGQDALKVLLQATQSVKARQSDQQTSPG